jgi:hypothetical protein
MRSRKNGFLTIDHNRASALLPKHGSEPQRQALQVMLATEETFPSSRTGRVLKLTLRFDVIEFFLCKCPFRICCIVMDPVQHRVGLVILAMLYNFYMSDGGNELFIMNLRHLGDSGRVYTPRRSKPGGTHWIPSGSRHWMFPVKV